LQGAIRSQFEKSWFVKAVVAWTQEVLDLERKLTKKTETEGGSGGRKRC
jgi:hypothetical protein